MKVSNLFQLADPQLAALAVAGGAGLAMSWPHLPGRGAGDGRATSKRLPSGGCGGVVGCPFGCDVGRRPRTCHSGIVGNGGGPQGLPLIPFTPAST